MDTNNEFHQIVADEYSKGTPLKTIASLTGRGINTVIRAAKRLNLTHPNRDNRLRGKMDEDSSLIGGIVMEPTKAQLEQFKLHCEEHGLPFENWRSFWDVSPKEGGGRVSAFFTNKEAEQDFLQMQEDFVKQIKKHAPKYRKPKYLKITDPHLQIIDVADLHIGKYAIARDGTVAYDMDKAIQMAHDGVQALLSRSKPFPTEKFIFPIGNDVVHIDNKNNMTTKGTRQDTDGMWHEMVRAAVVMYREIIDKLALYAPVEVVYNPANHDEHLAFNVATVLEAMYDKHPTVSFRINPHRDREYILYGDNMIGLDHGDGAKMSDIPLLMAAEEPNMWGKARHRYMIRHHQHHWNKTQFLVGKDFPGITVQYTRSLSASDDWHQKKGYVGAPQAIDSFIFHPEFGQVDHMSAVFSRSA